MSEQGQQPEQKIFTESVVEPDCHICPLKGTRRVLSSGPRPVKLCIVGESPGTQEIREGKGFVGKSGEMLWHLAANCDYPFTRDEVMITNAFACLPKPVRLPLTGAVLSLEEVKRRAAFACRRRLIADLRMWTADSPTAMFSAVGRIALESITGLQGLSIMALRGALFNINLIKAWADVQEEKATGRR